ncbi:HAD family hydrolase [Priestia taiwanensis]|uniref:Haloacid dehalogenase n=1 Tax=Priestia taiwanensis TaxID=1347902 RepID=A0A917ATN5_9BACI|nr:HAD family hydrolase [Priestia taiwanensis]MBM7364297.1 Cof subfamily protein (haloacid dehalogenase superfamily) [Priestia taiwanensis]GGE73303.1 haloacid dehalogenase [Priestia taiwanensis]
MDCKADIKAIVLDLDGTLLNSRKEVSERCEQAILTCYKNGMTIIFATARAPRFVRIFLPQELREIASIIYYNGALIEEYTTSYRRHYPIEPSIAHELIEYIVLHDDVALSVESEDRWYSTKTLDYSKAMNAVVNPIVVSREELKSIPASKLLISDYPKYEMLHQQFKDKVSMVCTDEATLIQIMAHGVTKKREVMELCTRHHISMDYVMPFGDDWNDMELFQACQYPVAMGNAIQELKEVAYLVTSTNDEDGVANVLERLM